MHPSRFKNFALVTSLLASLLSVIPFQAHATPALPDCIPEVIESGGYITLEFTSLGTCTYTAPTGTTVMQGLIVGGGGGGGNDMGGGGGGGGYVDFETLSVTSQTLTISVGAGGAGAPDGSGPAGTSGENSAITGSGISLTALGGAGGASRTNYEDAPARTGGGSGGGGSGGVQSSSVDLSSHQTQESQTQTPILDSIGGIQLGNNGSPHCLGDWYPGGGGGAGSAGSCAPGNGGSGYENSILGTTYFWAGGGGGAGHSHVAGNGGSGGGGGGAVYQGGPSIGTGGSGIHAGAMSLDGNRGGSGGDNTGGGGGGGAFNSAGPGYAGGNGGSGIVVLKFAAKSPTGAATRLRIARPSAGFGHGAAFTTQPQIGFADSAFNSVGTGSAVITATISSGGTLIGTATASASGGSATFSNLGVDGLVGKSYTLTYSAPGFSPAIERVTLANTTCDGTSFRCQVGDIDTNGGLIFYAPDAPFKCGPNHADDCFYLEAAPNTWSGGSTDSTAYWSSNTYPYTGVEGISRDASPNLDSTQIGLGLKNSNNMAASDSSTGSAAVSARTYVDGSGHSDWYLPTIGELGLLCQMAHGQIPVVGRWASARNL